MRRGEGTELFGFGTEHEPFRNEEYISTVNFSSGEEIFCDQDCRIDLYPSVSLFIHRMQRARLSA